MVSEKNKKKHFYLKPASTHNGSVITDLPLIVIGRDQKKQIANRVCTGELVCIGKVYIKTRTGLIRIK